jgi:hypothetical protein
MTTSSRLRRQAAVGLLALLGGFSAWFLIPMMQDVSDGTATAAEGWVDGLIPLTLAVLAWVCATRSSRQWSASAGRPLVPFVALTVVWALTSGFESGSDLLYATCLLGMPVLALVGSAFAVRSLGQPLPVR